MPPTLQSGRPAIVPQVTAPPVTPAVTQPPATQSSSAIDPKIINLAKAIRQTESGGNYQAKGGSGEYGAYQFEPSTWNETAPKYGVTVPLQQASQEQQNEVAVKQLTEWATEHPDWNIGNFASAWNAGAGKPNAYKEGNSGTNSQGVKYDTATYAKNVALAYQAIKNGQNGQTQTQPTAPSAPANPNATPPAQNEDLLSRAGDLFNTIFPNKNIGEAIGTELAKLFSTKNAMGESTASYVSPSTATVGGITGDLLQDAAWLVGGGEAVAPIEEASTLGRLGITALKGAKAGAVGGALGGAGNALSNGGNVVDAGVDALTGGLEGGAAGGILGGGLSLLPKIAGRVANGGIQSESNIAGDLTRNNLGNTGAFTAEDLTKGATAFEANANKANDTAGQVVQGTRSEAEQASSVLKNVNTAGVKTYEDLSDRLQQAIDAHQTVVDSELKSNNNPVKLSQLGQKVEVGEGAAKVSRNVNYVKDAIGQLKDFYNKTGNVQDALKMESLQKKASTEGITPKEINDLARQHGRALNGFNANGELASGLSRQAAENTRKGLKATARSFLKSDVAQRSDQATSELISTKDLVDSVAKKVNALSQRVQKRNMIEKIARSLGHGVDVATGGAIKSFVSKLFFPSNVGLKTFNALDLEARLQRNLKILQRLNGSTDTDVEKFIRAIIGSLVTKR